MKNHTQSLYFYGNTIIIVLILSACIQKKDIVRINIMEETPYKGITIITPQKTTNNVNNEKYYTFGFDQRLDLKDDVKMYLPFLKYLEQETGLNFQLRILNKDKNIVTEMINGNIDIAALGPLGYIEVSNTIPATILAKGNNENSGYYRAAIIVSQKSSISSINALRGKTFAFGKENSTQGYHIPKMMIIDSGLEMADLTKYNFLSSHSDVSKAVIQGQYDAGGIQDTLAEKLQKQGYVKIIAYSEFYPTSGIVSTPAIAAENQELIKQALLKFKPDQLNYLDNWNSSEMPYGFISVDPSEYDKIKIEYQQFKQGVLK